MDSHLKAYREEILNEIRQTLAGCHSMALIALLNQAKVLAADPRYQVAQTGEELSQKALAYAKPERRGHARHDGTTITQLEDVTYRLLRGEDAQRNDEAEA